VRSEMTGAPMRPWRHGRCVVRHHHARFEPAVLHCYSSTGRCSAGRSRARRHRRRHPASIGPACVPGGPGVAAEGGRFSPAGAGLAAIAPVTARREGVGCSHDARARVACRSHEAGAGDPRQDERARPTLVTPGGGLNHALGLAQSSRDASDHRDHVRRAQRLRRHVGRACGRIGGLQRDGRGCPRGLARRSSEGVRPDGSTGTDPRSESRRPARAPAMERPPHFGMITER